MKDIFSISKNVMTPNVRVIDSHLKINPKNLIATAFISWEVSKVSKPSAAVFIMHISVCNYTSISFETLKGVCIIATQS